MIAIIDSGGANIASVVFALKRLGKPACLTSDKKIICSASHVILPGVGAAANAMRKLIEFDLITTIPALTQPVLGICLGMQLLYEYSAEGNVVCLGIFSGKVEKIPLQNNLVIPHMGWNTLNLINQSCLTRNIPEKSYMYFVHSYIAPVTKQTCAFTQYGKDFSAITQNKNFYATQFHPERSGEMGAKLLQNFVEL